MNSANSIRQASSSVPKSSKQDALKELSQVVNRSHEVLATATTVFPMTLFPDTVTVDREKLTTTRRMFFRVAESMSIRIADILNVTADVGPVFGSLKIATRFFDPQKPYPIKYLWRDDAIKLKSVIQGYVIALQQGVDCTSLATQDLTKMLQDLGQGALNEEI